MVRSPSYIVLLCLSGLTCFQTSAQEILVEGEARVLENDPFKTKPVYEMEAYRLAVSNAIEKTFGSSVSSNYERLVETIMSGRSVDLHSDIRNNYTNTFPNGEWIRDVSRDFREVKDQEDNYWMICRVKGYASKIEAAEVEFVTKTLDGTDITLDETIDFIHGEDGYLYFKSPRPGYLIVFYDDMKNVQRCVPYNGMTEGELKVEANKEYLFFSRRHADHVADKSLVDEIEFFTEKPLEYNQLYIVFSPAPFSAYFLDAPKDLGFGYKSFRSMEKAQFHRWLQNNRIRNKDLQVQVIGVSIKKS